MKKKMAYFHQCSPRFVAEKTENEKAKRAKKTYSTAILISAVSDVLLLEHGSNLSYLNAVFNERVNEKAPL